MSIIKRIFGGSSEKRNYYVAPTTSLGLPYGFPAAPLSLSNSLQLSAVYRCVEVVSDSIATQQWDIMNYNKAKGWTKEEFHDLYFLLNYSPSPAIGRYMFLKTLVAKVLLEGNGYAIIRRDQRGDPERLELVNLPVNVYMRPDKTLFYKVGYEGSQEAIDAEDMIHIMNFSYNGYIGVSTLTHAATSMGLADSAEASAKGFFASGANMSGILTVQCKLTPEKATALKSSWAAAFDITSGQPGGIAVMESGMEFKPVTVNPKDAQMLETRQFNVLEICRFFGVPPSKAFAQEGLTYSNVEAYQLGFITDTVTPMDSRIESEFNRKLLRPSQRGKTIFNLNPEVLMKANLDSMANYYSKMFQSGGFTVNEIRQKLGNEKMPGGDEPMVQVNMQKLNKTDNGEGNKKPGEPGL